MPHIDTIPAVAALLAVLAVELVLLRSFGDRAQSALLTYASARPHRKILLYPLIAPGVALHELAHALTCVAVGAPLGKIVLFHPRTLPDGSRMLGYVQHGRARLPFGNLLVAVAPLVLPPVGLYALAPVLVPGAGFHLDPAPLAHALAGAPVAPGTLLWALLALSISLSAFPSDADLRGIGIAVAVPAALLALLPVGLALRTPAEAQHLLAPYLWLTLLLLPGLVASAAAVGLLRPGRLHRG